MEWLDTDRSLSEVLTLRNVHEGHSFNICLTSPFYKDKLEEIPMGKERLLKGSGIAVG